MSKISAESLLSHTPHTAFVLEADINNSDSSIIFVAHLLDSTITKLEDSGSLIWEILSQPVKVEDIVAEVAEIFKETPETVYDGVIIFLEKLLKQDLIRKVSIV